MACVVSLTDQTFEQEVVKESRPVLVDFSAEWCPPCDLAAPVMEELCTTAPHGLKVVKVEVEKCLETSRRHNIQAMPTFVLYRGGKVLSQTRGFGSKRALVNWVEQTLSNP